MKPKKINNKFLKKREDLKEKKALGKLFNEVTIKIDTAQNVIVEHETCKGIRSKHITLDELYDLIDHCREGESQNNKFSSPVYYPKTDIISTVMIKNNDNDEDKIIVLHRKSKPCTMKYYDSTFENIGIPGIVFGIKIISKSIRKCYVACVKDKVITPQTKLFKYPFSNVFFDTGICWGANRLPEINDMNNLSVLARIPNMFLAIDNNDHNYFGRNNYKLSYRKLLEFLQNKNFNEDKLIPLGDSRNVDFAEWAETL